MIHLEISGNHGTGGKREGQDDLLEPFLSVSMKASDVQVDGAGINVGNAQEKMLKDHVLNPLVFFLQRKINRVSDVHVSQIAKLLEAR